MHLAGAAVQCIISRAGQAHVCRARLSSKRLRGDGPRLVFAYAHFRNQEGSVACFAVVTERLSSRIPPSVFCVVPSLPTTFKNKRHLSTAALRQVFLGMPVDTSVLPMVECRAVNDAQNKTAAGLRQRPLILLR